MLLGMKYLARSYKCINSVLQYKHFYDLCSQIKRISLLKERDCFEKKD